MGNTESHQEAYKLENEQSNLITKKYYFDKYNWVPSLPGHEYLTIDNTFIKRKFGNLSNCWSFYSNYKLIIGFLY